MWSLLWFGCAVAAPPIEAEAPLPAAQPASSTCPASLDTESPGRSAGAVVVVWKGARRSGLYHDGALVGCWPIALGAAGDAGPKRQEGDLRTPEGWYRLSDRPWSAYYGAVSLHYPSAKDAASALSDGRIDAPTHARIVAAEASGAMPPQDTALGSHLLLHGGGVGVDWTLGCVAYDNADIDALRAGLEPGARGWAWIQP